MHFPERKGKDSQKMHKKAESKISRRKHQQSTPIIPQLWTNLQNNFSSWLFLPTIPTVFFNNISSPRLFYFSLSLSFFLSIFFERIINARNFRKSFKSRTNRRQGTLLLSPLTRRNSLEEIFHRFSNARRRTCEWIEIETRFSREPIEEWNATGAVCLARDW